MSGLAGDHQACVADLRFDAGGAQLTHGSLSERPVIEYTMRYPHRCERWLEVAMKTEPLSTRRDCRLRMCSLSVIGWQMHNAGPCGIDSFEGTRPTIEMSRSKHSAADQADALCTHMLMFLVRGARFAVAARRQTEPQRGKNQRCGGKQEQHDRNRTLQKLLRTAADEHTA